ncbi:hypothetical protein AB5J55_21345 [Streptomyces sp. R11]|uniref:Uncharacterized protein n=1 Tax=Streptomyces sp. R11 TaxID=3238625 RepID=A0AB39N086_9ACTN
MPRRAVPERRDVHLVRVTVLAVIGLVVALCLPSVGRDSAGGAGGLDRCFGCVGAGGGGPPRDL